MEKWINTKDKLPELNKRVLIFFEKEGYFFGKFTFREGVVQINTGFSTTDLSLHTENNKNVWWTEMLLVPPKENTDG
jgi:hypothetical protein